MADKNGVERVVGCTWGNPQVRLLRERRHDRYTAASEGDCWGISPTAEQAPPANVRLLEQSDPALAGEPEKGAGSGEAYPPDHTGAQEVHVRVRRASPRHDECQPEDRPSTSTSETMAGRRHGWRRTHVYPLEHITMSGKI